MRTMNLWDSLTTCVILLSAVCAGPLPSSRQQPAAADSAPELPPVRIRLSVTAQGTGRAEADWRETLTGGEKYAAGRTSARPLENVADFREVAMSRTRRSSSASPPSARSPSGGNRNGGTRRRRQRRKGGNQPRGKGDGGGEAGRASRGGGRGQGCVLKQIHLNVSDLGLGYRSSEEMIFRYCSGPCRRSETNYDKILHSLSHTRRLPPRDAPQQACCRPVAFDDDLSFLDDSLVYHTVRKHSARKCGCV